MKGISTIIATILLVIITISLVGVAYLFVSGLLTGQTSKNIKLMEASGHIVIIQNIGTQNITSNDIRVLVNGESRDIVNPQTIKPGDAVALKFIPPNFGNEVISANVIVVGPSNSLNYKIDFIPHEPKVDSGTVGLWHFNSINGGYTLDETNNHNDGQVVGASPETNCKFGSCLSFDGSNDNVNVPDSASLDIINELTIEAWVKPNTLNPSADMIILRKEGVGDNYDFFIGGGPPYDAAKGNLGFVHGDASIPGGWEIIDSEYKLPDTDWHHVTVVFGYNIHKVNFYDNGRLMATKDIQYNIAPNNAVLTIGSEMGLAKFFNGAIDEVSIYNRALTQEEILDSIYG